MNGGVGDGGAGVEDGGGFGGEGGGGWDHVEAVARGWPCCSWLGVR